MSQAKETHLGAIIALPLVRAFLPLESSYSFGAVCARPPPHKGDPLAILAAILARKSLGKTRVPKPPCDTSLERGGCAIQGGYLSLYWFLA